MSPEHPLSRLGPVLALHALSACEPEVPPSPPCGVAHGQFVATDDGAVIHLHRHQAAGPPVLVVHGISSNHYCWDLDPERSLGSYLAERGLDAWLLDLRGHGDARKAPGGWRLDRSWNADDYGLHDIPAAIAAIRAETGARQVAYVGHSLGGMVGAIYASQVGDQALSAMVVVGSPAEFHDPDPMMQLTRRSFGLSGSTLPLLATPPLARLANAWNDALPLDVEALLFNDANMEPEAARRMMHAVVSPLWPGEMLQFAGMLDAGRFQSADGLRDYRADMGRLRVPLLVIAGRADRVAPPDRVRGTYEAAGSPEKRFVVAGLENGFAADYGHLDLPLGDHARAEIYPRIAEWVLAHPPALEAAPGAR